MRNMYFEGNYNGAPMITNLECYCLLQQRMKFCVKHRKPVFAVTHPDLMESYGFMPKDTNPRGCEGERKNRVYYSWQGSVHCTQNKFKKVLIKMLFKKMKYKEE